MFYVIQTNISLNNYKKPQDFQSLMYKISNQTWEEFKEYILSDEDFTEKLIKGTMIGYTKPKNCIIEDILINDDFHLEVNISYRSDNHMTNVKFYKVSEDDFKNLL
ncbi:uncharacterized protein CBO05P1_004 [Clostridium botulinum B str. Osaka05]|uniref:Uncharacterized protein n=1 Tax=Clostridium botulinum B str. Osaka05 TaxID=1407017 RepID=A0A060N8G5_CLOBO|nr:hypothetical protein [Clostridium botulinum]BAO04723.1 uncharacterized protein CBO05P1_004 [Clostridium botulinum B str. Osaka05]